MARRARSPRRLEYDDHMRTGANRSSSAPRPSWPTGPGPQRGVPQRGSSRYTPDYYDTVERTDTSSSSSSEDEDPRVQRGYSRYTAAPPQRGALKQSRPHTHDKGYQPPPPDYARHQGYARRDEVEDEDEDEDEEETAQPPAHVWDRNGAPNLDHHQHQPEYGHQPQPQAQHHHQPEYGHQPQPQPQHHQHQPEYVPPRQSPPSPPSPPSPQHPPSPPNHAHAPVGGTWPPAIDASTVAARPPNDLSGNLSPMDPQKKGARRLYENYVSRIPAGTPRRLILCHGRIPEHKPTFEHSIHVDKDPNVHPDIVGDLTNPALLADLPDESFDSIVFAYPPRWLFFQETQGNPPAVVWSQIRRILSPKGYVIALGLYEALWHKNQHLLQQKKKKSNGLFGGSKKQQSISKDKLDPIIVNSVRHFMTSVGLTRVAFPNRDLTRQYTQPEVRLVPPQDVIVLAEK